MGDIEMADALSDADTLFFSNESNNTLKGTPKYLFAREEFDAFVRNHVRSIAMFSDSLSLDCYRMELVLKDLAAEEIPIAIINLDKLPELAQDLNIQSTPCMVIFHNGDKVKEMSGHYTADEIRDAFHQTTCNKTWNHPDNPEDSENKNDQILEWNDFWDNLDD
jgi:thioredoxin-like negative regulator of GroEL